MTDKLEKLRLNFQIAMAYYTHVKLNFNQSHGLLKYKTLAQWVRKTWMVIFQEENFSKVDHRTSLIQIYHYKCNGLINKELKRIIKRALSQQKMTMLRGRLENLLFSVMKHSCVTIPMCE